MTIAIVKDGVFKHTTNEAYVMDGDWNRPTNVPLADRKQFGFYDFVPARNEPPAGKKPQGTTFTVDDDVGTVTESFLCVDMTAQEIKDATNKPLDQQIDSLETQEKIPRKVREILLELKLAHGIAAGKTEANMLDKNHADYSFNYAKLYKTNADAAALRAQRV